MLPDQARRDMINRLNPAVQAFVDPVDMLATVNPLLALAALDPSAALAAVSPALRMLSPAVNPAAALLAFNPGAAPGLALMPAAVHAWPRPLPLMMPRPLPLWPPPLF